MSATSWQAAVWVLSAAFAACGWGAARGGPWRRLPALQLAATLLALDWIALAVVIHAPYLLGLALVLVLASGVGTLAFARFLERGR